MLQHFGVGGSTKQMINKGRYSEILFGIKAKLIPAFLFDKEPSGKEVGFKTSRNTKAYECSVTSNNSIKADFNNRSKA